MAEVIKYKQSMGKKKSNNPKNMGSKAKLEITEYVTGEQRGYFDKSKTGLFIHSGLTGQQMVVLQRQINGLATYVDLKARVLCVTKVAQFTTLNHLRSSQVKNRIWAYPSPGSRDI